MLGGSDATKKCGLLELLVFVAAIVAGTACSILSKTMMGLQGEGMTGQQERFEKPIFQTFGMFLGMTFGLVMHWVVLACKIPFPGYEHNTVTTATTTASSKKSTVTISEGGPAKETDGLLKSNGNGTTGGIIDETAHDKIPVWMYFFLAIPAVFDLGATALCMMGLQYIDVSIYQLLRGSGTLPLFLFQFVMKGSFQVHCVCPVTI